ncbi:MAG: VanW family protein [Clostridiales bacterium]|nr:VanW family protein [Clostridiales bacterium]
MKHVSSNSRPMKDGKTEKSKTNSKLTGAVGIVCGVLVFALAAFIAYVIYGSVRWEGILPNVYAYGVDLSGMSQSEAEAALANELESPGSGVSLVLPNGSVMELPRSDSIAGYDAGAAAARAWNYGRRNGKVSPFRYAFSLMGSVELYENALGRIDGGALRAAISEKAAAINYAHIEGAYSVSGSNLTIVKGTSGVLLDEDEVYRVARTALENGESTVSYTPPESTPKPLDLDGIYKAVCREARNAEFDSKFNVIKSINGLTFDLEQAKALYDEAEEGAVISITLSTVHPEISTEELSALLYRDRLASWTSTLTNNETRSKNIELAASAVNGLVLLPGEKFSFNETVGQRTTERGFGAAAAYSNGETVYEVGGGICQVSSSIYYCCLMADMDIVRRTCHLYTAPYVPLGMDATVSWGGPEFEFSNSSDYPIKIVTWRDGNELYCELYGTKTSDEYIKMSYEIVERYDYETIFQEDESIEPGRTKIAVSGITGYKVVTYRSRFSADGSIISRAEEDTSVYSKRDQVVLVAPGELHLYVHGANSPEPGSEPAAVEETMPTLETITR